MIKMIGAAVVTGVVFGLCLRCDGASQECWLSLSVSSEVIKAELVGDVPAGDYRWAPNSRVSNVRYITNSGEHAAKLTESGVARVPLGVSELSWSWTPYMDAGSVAAFRMIDGLPDRWRREQLSSACSIVVNDDKVKALTPWGSPAPNEGIRVASPTLLGQIVLLRGSQWRTIFENGWCFWTPHAEDSVAIPGIFSVLRKRMDAWELPRGSLDVVLSVGAQGGVLTEGLGPIVVDPSLRAPSSRQVFGLGVNVFANCTMEWRGQPGEGWVMSGLAKLFGEEVVENVTGRGESFRERRRVAWCAVHPLAVDGLVPSRLWKHMSNHLVQDAIIPLLTEGLARDLGMEPSQLAASLLRNTKSDYNIQAIAHVSEAPVAELLVDLLEPPVRGSKAISERIAGVDAGSHGACLDLVLTGGTDGFLETCGCAVNQYGGAAKRVGVVRNYKGDAGNAVIVDLGRRYGQPNEIRKEGEVGVKRLELIDSLFALHAGLIWIPTPEDIAIRLAAGLDLPPGVVAANTAAAKIGHVDVNSSTGGSPSWRLVGLCGWNPAEISYGDPAYLAMESSYEFDGYVESVERVVTQAKPAGETIRNIVVGQIPVTMCHDIAGLDGVSAVITTCSNANWAEKGGRARGYTVSSHYYEGKPIVVLRGGTNGVDSVSLVENSSTNIPLTFRHEWTWLGDDVGKDLEAAEMIDEFYQDVEPVENWSIEPVLGEEVLGRTFVGSDVCRNCHSGEYDKWRATAHSVALHSIIRAKRDMVAGCVKCHVTGLGASGGYSRWQERVAGLDAVGCEVCHGAGSEHAQNPSVSNIARSCPPERCAGCHDAEHSPEFSGSVERRYESIRHW